jgi:hypothetical protein
MSLSKEQRDLILAVGSYTALFCMSAGGEWIEPINNQDHRLLTDLCGLGEKMDYLRAGRVMADLVKAVASGK